MVLFKRYFVKVVVIILLNKLLVKLIIELRREMEFVGVILVEID